MEEPLSWLNPVLLIPRNNYLEQDMQELFQDCDEVATVQLLRRGRHVMVRDQ